MGFRTGAYATVWEVSRVSDTLTKGRISINRKNKNTGEYVQDFGGYVAFIGTACASKALKLKERARIKLDSVDVSTKYDKERNKTFTDFNIFSFDIAETVGESSAEDQNNTTGDDDLSGDLPF